jgi:hypothetical protein
MSAFGKPPVDDGIGSVNLKTTAALSGSRLARHEGQEMRLTVASCLAIVVALALGPTPVLGESSGGGGVQASSDSYFSHLTTAEQKAVYILADRAKAVLAEINADEIRFSQDYAAVQLMEVLKPPFVQVDADGSETRRRLARARALLERARNVRRERDAEFGQVIASSQLSPKLKEHYRSALEALLNQARPEREKGYKLLDQMFDEVEAAAKVLREAKWDHQSYGTLADADARAFNDHASRANALIQQKASLDSEMRQQAVAAAQR